MKPVLSGVVAPLLVAASLTATSPATAADGDGDGDPGYAITPFHVSRTDNPELARGWRAWKARDHQRYTTTVERSCFCLPEPPTTTQIQRGRVTSVTFEDDDEQLDRPGFEMDALYRQLRRAYRTAEVVDVRYRRGVPVRVFIDGDRLIADDELGLRVRVSQTDPAEPFAYAITPFHAERSDREVLRESWKAWRDAGIRSYVVTTRRQAGEGTFPTVRTYVDGPAVREVRAVGGGSDPERGDEIERLYRMIRSLYRTADSVRVRYDEQGVPRRISADPIAGAVDDELVLRVRLREA